MPVSPAGRIHRIAATTLLLLAAAGTLRAAPAAAPVSLRTSREIKTLYTRYDAAFGIRSETRFRRALGSLLAPAFTERTPAGVVTRRDRWLRERTAAAALGARPWPGNTGGFRSFDRLSVRAATEIESIGGSAERISVLVTESITTVATGRHASGGPPETTSAVFTTEARDQWRRAKAGWVWERRYIVARRAISSISVEASSSSKGSRRGE